MPPHSKMDDVTCDDIEAAYLAALEASEAAVELVEAENGPIAEPQPEPSAEPIAPAPAASAPPEDDAPRVSPAQVIEAALFVGGAPLTARKLCGLLRGNYESTFIEDTIEALNRQYAEQARPYVIRLRSGGYRLELQPDFERFRHRVHGTGPREVKLSQDVLEVLAIVAYKQPVSVAEIEAVGKKNAGNLLRQLLQRDLIRLTRGENGPKDVRYHTTPRFLQLFGLASLNDLPQAEDVATK
jgi:segregation and condensation protein B